ncbi:hypothetical protein HOF67_01360 [Candidatus Peregrinibacteria bacterium]|jgi:hypothetical protein|nr:hypothetical protein [Candidatus Peregrinibacteria bacterium]
MDTEKTIKTPPCRTCKQNFEITDRDIAFYKKIEAPEPKDCYHCRQRRRQSYRNERHLYKDTCDLCKKSIISIYSEDKTFPVYCSDCWFGDGWDRMDYGQDYDPSRSFFDQWNDLWKKVPKLGLLTLGQMENSDYTHDAIRLTNCYLIFDGEQAKDCMYGETFYLTKDCADFLFLMKSELCYECTNCNDCYNLNYSQFCNNCNESAFLQDCTGCQNCLGCVNRHRAKFEIFNKQYSEEEYNEKIKQYGLHDYNNIQKFKQEFKKFVQSQPKKSTRGLQNENITGDNIHNSKDTFYSFDCADLRDCKYMTNCVMKSNDCMDVDIWGGMDRCYNCECVGEGAQNIIACYYVAFNVRDCYHSAFCMKSNHDLLGCVALIHKHHCILNKQYSEEEYTKLFAQIKAQMQKSGEWMEFFPIQTSAFKYNETVAQEYFPITKEQAAKWKIPWQEKDPAKYKPVDFTPPDTIAETDDSILKQILGCETCGKNYRLVSQELDLYRKKNIPVPHQCSDCRHTARMQLRNPRFLYKRKCSKSGEDLETTISPKRPEAILSPEEFVKEFF